MQTHDIRSWAVSLALHGSLLGLGLAFLPPTPLRVEPPPLRMEFTLAQPVIAPAVPSPPTPRHAAAAKPASPPPHSPAPTQPPRPPTISPATEAVSPSLQTTSATDPVTAPRAAYAPPLEAATAARPAAIAPPQAEQVVTDTPTADAKRRWLAALAQRMSQLRRYPPLARRLGQEGVVVLTLVVSEDARQHAVRLREGSGYPLLDREAMRLVEEASAAVSAEMQADTPLPQPLELVIPVAYRLENSPR